VDLLITGRQNAYLSPEKGGHANDFILIIGFDRQFSFLFLWR
jgi:hypothetical protein